MKKTILLLLLTFPFLFMSCDDDISQEISLNGTKWIREISEEDYERIETFTFTSSTFMFSIEEWIDEEYSINSSNGSFVQTFPSVTFQVNSGETLTGRTSGSKMTVINAKGETSIYIKQ